MGPFAAIAGAVGLCCGLPVLLSLGVLGTVAGLSLQSWALIGLGLVLVLAAVGWVRWAKRRRSPRPACDPRWPGSLPAPGSAEPPTRNEKENHR